MHLWFEESDKQVWHLMTRRAGPLDYHAACGWHLAPYSGRVWPQKDDEPGPTEDERCRSCVGKE
jgi:hypothetical protein